MPIPPLTGNKGSGVMFRMAAPASKAGCGWPRIAVPPQALHNKARQMQLAKNPRANLAIPRSAGLKPRAG